MGVKVSIFVIIQSIDCSGFEMGISFRCGVFGFQFLCFMNYFCDMADSCLL